jgi:hypothetical protein
MPAPRRHRMAAMPLPKWIQGTPSEDHEFLRTSAATRTWELRARVGMRCCVI